MRRLFLCAAVLVLSGCVTKHAGALSALPPQSCEQIATERAELAIFEQRIVDNSNIDARSMASFFLDFGIGNKRERRRAVRAARDRRAQLDAAATAQGCAPG